VDSLCIILGDSGSQKAAIDLMDRIFESVAATIVADFGDNPDAGLLGVHPKPIRLQHRKLCKV
jgi:hypothetical protein